jgi:hypothetical protein
MIRKLLSVLPTRPILYIAPLIVVLVMSFYYRDIYVKCEDNKQVRTSLNRLLKSASAPAQFRLKDFTDFGWDKVRIIAGFKPEKRNSECPFGWNWARGERDSLIASGLLTVLIFAQEGMVIKYLELRGDEVAFEGTDTSLTAAEAVFSVGRNFGSSDGVSLTLKN